MGSLRTLFAISVALTHSLGTDVLVGGRNAVQLFYMISGFLISYVLVERKAYPNVKRFYINRYLRLYPIYFVVALLTLITFTIAAHMGREGKFFKIYSDAPYAADFLLLISNITLFFQDWVMFAGVENNHLAFTTNFTKSDLVLYPALLVPQAWTLGVELTFYVIAPFILFKQRIIILLLAMSILLRCFLVYIGLGSSDPWTYRFFPTELALFLAGALAHQVLLPRFTRMLTSSRIKKYSKLVTFLLVLITLMFPLIPGNEAVKSLMLLALFLLLMPLTFIFQSNSKWDKWIGDLSYPIYVSHMLVIYVATFVVSRLFARNEIRIAGRTVAADMLITGFGTVVLTIAFAIVLNKLVGGPIESLRNRFRMKSPAS